jgi:hypothetical protein
MQRERTDESIADLLAPRRNRLIDGPTMGKYAASWNLL